MTKTKDQPKELFETAMLAFADNDYEKSIELFTQTLSDDAANILARISRGAAYLKLDMLDFAWNDFSRAIAVNPDYARAYHMRGLVNEKKGDTSAALADFDRAIELAPEYGAAYYSRATLHTKLYDTDKAQEDIQMVTHLGNRNLASYMNENNVWQTQHMRVEDYSETELER
ncbi:tetratricopeptide repeat domain protein [Desulfosarcina variabilis str. Montpellier]|uniref:tetratricopeptide repeat protein n=1 Tax=Desulfosarcina variabilis TaxID=2300 RepID=UPI003AFB2526